MLRTLAAAMGPVLTGWLAGEGRFGVAFLVGGGLRVGYDLGLWVVFRRVRVDRFERTTGSGDVGGGREVEIGGEDEDDDDCDDDADGDEEGRVGVK